MKAVVQSFHLRDNILSNSYNSWRRLMTSRCQYEMKRYYTQVHSLNIQNIIMMQMNQIMNILVKKISIEKIQIVKKVKITEIQNMRITKKLKTKTIEIHLHLMKWELLYNDYWKKQLDWRDQFDQWFLTTVHKLIIKLSFNINLLTWLKYLILIFWLNLNTWFQHSDSIWYQSWINTWFEFSIQLIKKLKMILNVKIYYFWIYYIRSTMRFICIWCQLRIFWFYVLNRSQKSQEISIQRNLNNVRMLHERESWSCRVFIYTTTFLLTVTINLWRRLMTCWC